MGATHHKAESSNTWLDLHPLLGTTAQEGGQPRPLWEWAPKWLWLGTPGESESFSLSVMSNSLWPHGGYSASGSSAHGILQARTLEWVAISFSGGSSQPMNPTWISYTAGRFFTIWATREAHKDFQRGGGVETGGTLFWASCWEPPSSITYI